MNSISISCRNWGSSLLLLALGGFSGFSLVRAADDNSQDFDARARAIVARMTLEEKVSQMHGTKTPDIFRVVVGIPRLGIPDLLVTNGPAGFGLAGKGHESAATALPAPISLASTWDVDAAHEDGVIEASEAAGFGNNFFEAPDTNIARVPQNGRTFEAFGEDPFLTGRLAVATIQGIQSQGILANVKHYAVNNQEKDRKKINVEVDERTLRELYLPAFEASIKEGKCATIMGALNRLNGTYCCENDLLFNQILFKEWGFRGFSTSDFGAVHSTEGTVLHGVDVEMPESNYLGDPLLAAIKAGTIPVAAVDERLVRRFRTMMEFGFWDHPLMLKPIPVEKDNQTALRLAAEGIVLLKNEGALLPLDSARLKTVALMGPGAEKAKTGGGGSSEVKPDITPMLPVDGLRRALGSNIRVTFYKGSQMGEAVAAAKAADVAIVMVEDAQSEGGDHKIELGGSQDELIDAVASANPRTVVVLKTGGPILMPWIARVPAVVEAWYPGQMDAEAVAAVLTGQVNPGAKLPITFPKRLADLPAHTPEQYPGVNGVVKYSEGVMVGYRWYDNQKIQPLFAFGHGLSYSTFRYDKLKFSDDDLSTTDPKLIVEFDVTNESGPAGFEIAQLYLGIPSLPDAPQPPKQLKGFARLGLAAGATSHATISLNSRAFSHWDTAAHDWKVTPGNYTIYVGASSRDLRLTANVTIRSPLNSK